MIGKLCYRRLEKDKKYTPIWAGSKLSILVETDYWILNNEFNIQKVIRNYAETSIIEHLEFIKSISSEKGRCFIDIPVEFNILSNRKLGRSDIKIGLDYEPTLGLIIGDFLDYFQPVRDIELKNIKSLKWSLGYRVNDIALNADIVYIFNSFRIYSACINLLTKL